MSSFSVLFVCLGNICRSPMAEAAFTTEAKKRNLIIKIDSAAIGLWHVNDPPDPRTIKEVARHDIDIKHYLGRQISENDFYDFTHIIGMDHKNIIKLNQMKPGNSNAEIKLFMDYVPNQHNTEIADPYYGTAHDFEKTWNQISLATAYLANYFEQKS